MKIRVLFQRRAAPGINQRKVRSSVGERLWKRQPLPFLPVVKRADMEPSGEREEEHLPFPTLRLGLSDTQT